ncbi:Pre-mRNA-splicing factor dre4 [Neolecta irregularis DAH-3]|uniref:Pre-mRNA-splicing factor dre4 n=1 Tax=Neolecta irregularis (strain DAH-3) TaxID=1198029 RepID=A0A1U7LVQ0_NEOID|nr:Pre-mRNA-splicing factor dre4 [Neolecta irregularis DAH-3]|eukprot:OLL26750.1 Pre-mRNA-splicing factor dre4 [Neolecta irregularis DAH-3]
MSTNILPQGWTVHTAPSGHLYYYHKESAKSTYIRPQFAQSTAEPPKPVALESHLHANKLKPTEKPDRPRFKKPIPFAEPWILVTTKKGRMFVHNLKTLESLWNIPDDIQPAVNALLVEEKKQDRRARGLPSEDEDEGIGQQLEFTEDDLAWQLAEIAQEDEQNNAYSHGSAPEPTLEEREMLLDRSVDPFSTWDAELSKIVNDPRYILIETTKNRRYVYDAWCRERSIQINAENASKVKQNPILEYHKLLTDHADSKIYWHEFRRKFKKDPAFVNFGDNDKQREKEFREFQSRLKLPKLQRENDLRKLLAKNKSKITSTNLPEDIMGDLCFATMDMEVRDRIVKEYIESFPTGVVESQVSNEVQRKKVADKEAVSIDEHEKTW